MSYRVRGIGRVPPVELPQLQARRARTLAERGARRGSVRFDGETIDCPVYQREQLDVGLTVEGPAVLDQFDCTTVLCPGTDARGGRVEEPDRRHDGGRRSRQPDARQVIIDAVDLEVVKASLSGIVQEMQNSLFRTGFSTIIRESQDASCALMNTQRRDHRPARRAAAAHRRVPGLLRRRDQGLQRRHRRRRRVPDQPSLPGRQPARARHVRASRRCSSTARCSASAARSRTRATSAARCREAAPARRARSSTRACICRRCATSARPYRNTDIERLIAANSRTPELVLGDIRGQLGSCRLARDSASTSCSPSTASAKVDRVLRAAVRARRGQGARRDRRMGRRPLRGRALHRRRRRRPRQAGAHPRGRREEGRPAALRFLGLGRPDQGSGQHPPAAGAGRRRLLPDLADRPAHLRQQRPAATPTRSDAREGSVLNPRFPAPVNTYNPTVHALVDAVFAALSASCRTRCAPTAAGSRSIIIGGRTTTTGKGYVQYEIFGGGAGARAGQGRRVGHLGQPEQCQDRVGRDHRKRVPDPPAALRADPRIPAAPGQFRGGLGIRREYLNLADARFSIRSTKHVIPPNGLCRRRAGPHRRHPDQSGARGREAPADALRRLSAEDRRRVPARLRRVAAATAIR